MKRIFYISIFLLIISCNNKDNVVDSYSNKEAFDKMKYQAEIFQVNNTEFTAITLNRLTGKVFIAKNAAVWYEATNKTKLVSYKTPAYSIKILNFDSNPQILLTNLKTAEMYTYIVGHTADFVDLNSNIKSLERGK